MIAYDLVKLLFALLYAAVAFFDCFPIPYQGYRWGSVPWEFLLSRRISVIY